MRETSTIGQLRTLNELFAHTGVSAPESAEHIRRVLDFFSEEHHKNASKLSFSESADRLAQLHFGPRQERKLLFAHWSVPTDEQFSPLWIRQSLIARMKQLAGSRAAFLLIIGLREAICPTGNYWTKKRQEYYDRVCNYINELVCEWATPGSRSQVVFFDYCES
ncbi:MAG: hypothetical protein ACJAT5_000096 [Lentimonas sp.]|jgi:hypothetical protein